MLSTRRILIILLGLIHPTFGQTNLPTSGKTLDNLKPNGWRFITSVTGDLNNDKLSDLVFIIQDTDTSKIVWDLDGGYCLTNTNPRIIAVYFADKLGGYIKQFQAQDFVPVKELENQEEPFDYVSINKNACIEFGTRSWFMAGTWETSHKTYQFQFNLVDKKFVLIKYESGYFDRSTGDFTNYQFDFKKNKLRSENGTMSIKKSKIKITKFVQEQNITWDQLESGEHFTINTIEVY